MSSLNRILNSALVVILVSGTVGSLYVLDRQRSAQMTDVELSYLPKGDYLKLIVLGYRQIAADLIWLKAVQTLGGRIQTTKGYRSAYHAVDVLTDLDPKFSSAYQVTGTILGIWGGLVKESVAILNKGMQHNPAVWELPFFLGYNYYYELHDPASAAKYFQMAADLSGAPVWLPNLAARMTVEAGDPNAALEFLQRIYQRAHDERIREGIAQRMREVIAERDIRFLEEGIQLYQRRYGKRPGKLDDLVLTTIIQKVPVEPFGGHYELKASDGTVMSKGLRERLRVHRN
jgi:tetratricopeptide (TPR) repeat protein